MMVVGDTARTEPLLLDGNMPCPRCSGALRPHGHGRTRTVRGIGAARVTIRPRRARCGDCGATHILLPTALTPRLADSTEVIGTALVAKVGGAGFRTIARILDRPETTVRRWLRRVRGEHADGLYLRGVEAAVSIERELLSVPAVHGTALGAGLNLLAGAAMRYRQRFALNEDLWPLIGILARGRLLAATIKQ